MAPILRLKRLTGWYWTGNTVINSVAVVMLMVTVKSKLLPADTIIDGTRNNAQLIEWNGANLAVDRLQVGTGQATLRSILFPLVTLMVMGS